MKTGTLQLLVAAPALLLAFLACSSFTTTPTSITNGGGEAGGKKFKYTAVMDAAGISGQFTWDGKTFDVICVYKPDSADGTASIYLSDGLAVNVVDGKKSDQISVPFLYTAEDCHAPATSLTDIVMQPVANGHLTVHQ
jgi:hypothetical protein